MEPLCQATYAVVTRTGCLLFNPDHQTFEPCPDAAGRRCGRPDACPHGVVLLPVSPN